MNAGILSAAAPVVVALAAAAAVFMNLMPFMVIGLSWLMLGETIRWYHLVGASVVIAGVGLTTSK